MYNKKVFSICFSLLLMTMAAPLMAGGFWLGVEPASGDGKAVLKVRPDGCHDPSQAGLKATAEGLINGERRTVPLELIEVGDGTFAVQRQWPSGGVWVLTISGTYRGMTRSVVFEVGPEERLLDSRLTADKRHRNLTRLPTRGEIDSTLKALASQGS